MASLPCSMLKDRAVRSRCAASYNALGEQILDWSDTQALVGFFAPVTGNPSYQASGRLDDSTHVFVCNKTIVSYVSPGVSYIQSSYAVDVREGDRLAVSGIVYRVDFVGDEADHIEIRLSLHKPGGETG